METDTPCNERNEAVVGAKIIVYAEDDRGIF